MKEETPKDITPIKRRGIEMAVKGLKKQYPFIIGYEDDTSVQYDASHYIDLIVDLDKLSEYMDTPVNPYWKTVVDTDPQLSKVYTIWSYLNFPQDMLEDVSNHPGYILSQELKSDLEQLYQYLPDEYKLFYKYQSRVFPDDPPKEFPVNLRVNGFIMS
jgi:hypothetical protein